MAIVEPPVNNMMTMPALPVKRYPFDVMRVRADFPILSTTINGKPLVYLDNGATTQKPNTVIDRMSDFYRYEYGTVRRGVYRLSARSTEQFDQSRKLVAQFINAASADHIIFTQGTTDAINLVAHSFGHAFLQPGDEIILSALEHHANIVPWQQIAQLKGASLRIIPVDDQGELDLATYAQLLNAKTKIVSVGHVSNAIGTVNPIQTMIELAHANGTPVLIDGAQGAPHLPVDVQALDCDFYAFSGHKVYGPTGIGVLYGKPEWLDKMGPYRSGGDMIDTVTFEKTTFAESPRRFEAGTPPITEVIGLGEAIRYVQQIGMTAIAEHEQLLLDYATEQIQTVPGVKIIGQAKEKAGIMSFTMASAHPHDIGTILDDAGIAIRAGHHCAQPVMTRYGVSATARASFGIYNTYEEIDALMAGLHRINQIFG